MEGTDLKRKKHFILFGILLLALINLSPSLPDKSQTGLRQQPSEKENEIQKAKSEQPLRDIEVYVMMDDQEFQALQTLNKNYEQQTDTVVSLVNIASEQAYKTYREAFAAGREPDVLMLDGTWVADFASSGRLLPIDLYEGGMAAASDSLSVSNASVEWNGYRWAVPLDLDPYGVIWNPEHFAETSGDLPEDTEAWNVWAEQQVTRLAQSGSESQSESVSKSILGFPDGDVRAFAALVSLWNNHKSEEAKQSGLAALELADQLRPYTQFEEMSAQERQMPSSFQYAVQSGELSLAVEPLSRISDEETSTMRVMPISSIETISLRGLSITASTDRSREASLWISYMTKLETQQSWYETTGHLPVLRAIYEQPSFTAFQRWLPTEPIERSAIESQITANFESSWSRSLKSFYAGDENYQSLLRFFQS
ncbi:extracellular solute-binding protein [Saccharibacillus sp. JS10]|uniref:extracellular solute-binding protein n=1 Tax=Saccharibacillus sp. JS10 TaxID=2950552 RepID=UPI00210E13C2|nr:extracellular solute-binding protein [Saccharibacillus sp. JS10]MCQ4086122.1 extracellular solute-binding protein [Saccharibacillus sp. JS10]